MNTKEQQILFLKTFKTVLKNELLSGNDVYLDGLGDFSLVHETKKEVKEADGSVMMYPPKNTLMFKGDKAS
jgi:nucleoid DNA-binding protein